jgi:uncharacterized membrane protein
MLVGLFAIKKVATFLSGSFWFIPSVMIAGAIMLSRVSSQYHSQPLSEFLTQHNLSVANAHSAIQIIELIASSSITITSIAFSMTIVALVMASSQFGPRLIKSFMEQKSTQLVLGTFTSTFVYCLLILHHIDADSPNSSYTDVSVFLAMSLAILCVFVLIFFIHHVATSIRADNVVNQVACEVLLDVQRLKDRGNNRTDIMFTEGSADANISGGENNAGTNTDTVPQDSVSYHLSQQYAHQMTIQSTESGYIQAIEYQSFIDIALQHDAVVQMHVRAGDYILTGTLVATVHSHFCMKSNIEINTSLVIGIERTALQDPLFRINQLVEMALRALSPSLNDPFTATNCIDRLSQGMHAYINESVLHKGILDSSNTLRVVTKDADVTDLFDGAYTQIRQSCYSHPFVLMHLIDAFTLLINANITSAQTREAIEFQIEAIEDVIDKESPLTSKSELEAYSNKMRALKNTLLYSLKN